MVRRLRRYVQLNGARQTAVAIGRLLGGLVYMEERLIVFVKDLDSIVEPWREGDLRVEDLGAEHLPGLSELNRKRGRPEVDRRFAATSSRASTASSPTAARSWSATTGGSTATCPRCIRTCASSGWGSSSARATSTDRTSSCSRSTAGGLATDFLFKVESSLRDRGYERLWGYVASDNRPARWIYSTRGYVPMWTVHRTRVLMVQRTTRESS